MPMLTAVSFNGNPLPALRVDTDTNEQQLMAFIPRDLLTFDTGWWLYDVILCRWVEINAGCYIIKRSESNYRLLGPNDFFTQYRAA